MCNVTIAKLIEGLQPTFAQWGIPKSLRKANGPQFTSDEFEQNLNEIGTEHTLTPPYWPQLNSEVKRQNQSLPK